MKILSIETSCDETSVAVLKNERILSNIVSSQVKLHAKWGGVVPNLAAREHVKNIVPVLDEALKEAKVKLAEIDLFATTQGPGLIPALLVGVNAAKALAWFYQKPLIGIHHIEAHVFASFTGENSTNYQLLTTNFPALALVVSGGHTQLMLSKKPFEYEIIGQTQDDAVGEAFDKVAKILDLGYPGGPIVSKLAKEYKRQTSSSSPLAKEELKNERALQGGLEFPRPMLDQDNFDFSFSGLKTSVLYKWEKIEKKSQQSSINNHQSAFCFAFQEAVTEVLVTKTQKAIDKYEPKTVILAGGVAANKQLREELKKMIGNQDEKISFLLPPVELCGDNAAMIGVAAFFRFLKQKKSGRLADLEKNWQTLEAAANLKLK